MKTFKLDDVIKSSIMFDFVFSHYGPRKGVMRFSEYMDLKNKIRRRWQKEKINTAREIRDEIRKEMGS